MTIRHPPKRLSDTPSGRAEHALQTANAISQIIVELGAVSAGGIADGDKGDIVVSGTGATWNFDSGVVSTFARTFLDDATAGDVRATIGAQAAGSYQTQDATLTALAAYNANGIICQTAADTFAGRTITAPAAGITVSNGDGVAGNPTLALADDLAALEALSGTNTIYYRSAANTWTAVTIGSGVSFSGGTLSATGGSFSGAMVKKSVDQTGANYSAGAIIAWDAEAYDTGTFHDNVTNNSRLTTPSGATYVQVGCELRLASVTAASAISLLLSKNGSTVFDGAAGFSDTVGLATPRFVVVSGAIPVTGGTDYFEVSLTCSDTSIDITASVSNFWMRVIA